MTLAQFYHCLIICSLLVACRPSAEQQLVYSDDRIRDVMIDLYIIAEILDDADPVIRDSLEQEYKTQLEIIHGVDMDSMQSDIKYIQLHAEQYAEIHEAVKDSLAVLEEKIKAYKNR